MNTKSNKLQAKDLINVGVFTAIYFVIFFAILGNSRFHNGHKIYEGVVQENIRSKDKSAGIINQCDHINTMLLPISGFQIGTGTGIPAPYLVDMWAFITAHCVDISPEAIEENHAYSSSTKNHSV